MLGSKEQLEAYYKFVFNDVRHYLFYCNFFKGRYRTCDCAFLAEQTCRNDPRIRTCDGTSAHRKRWKVGTETTTIEILPSLDILL